MDNKYNVTTDNFQPFSCPGGQEIFGSSTSTTFESGGTSSGSKITTTHDDEEQFLPHGHVKYQENPRKKRTKLIKNIGGHGGSNYGVRSGAISKPNKYGTKKPDPSAPKITRPCTECGKKFWSMKALFGHMRCHPERQWRGINPPPNLKPTNSNNDDGNDFEVRRMTIEDHEVATCLLMLANGGGHIEANNSESLVHTVTTSCNNISSQGILESSSDLFVFRDSDVAAGAGRFECSSCKKVFGSHQALGGHRASHKNVKGCFAINHKNVDGNGDDQDEDEEQQLDHLIMGSDNNIGEIEVIKDGGHKCSICLRVFSSGQALGGHKRCHWEKGDDLQAVNYFADQKGIICGGGLDLNLPPPAAAAAAEDSSCSYSSSGITLDLRLGL
ncbi:hypothetical protein M9H77_24980 [Catharanthus roseus]|uniref:Uncharacterized protein n=1 Tax=Catharanthus roseus TaxID=4058 RepID=A0ACC0A5N0_CATRO|nr:hypothetical protein M9H77_24980 [Catharanthus roseus]